MHHLSETTFSKSHFSETPPAKYDCLTHMDSRSLKLCRTNFEDRFTNKNFMQEKHLK